MLPNNKLIKFNEIYYSETSWSIFFSTVLIFDLEPWLKRAEQALVNIYLIISGSNSIFWVSKLTAKSWYYEKPRVERENK